MRCLYCGKELALFKRLTGAAEFCTDAHRKQYQAEYNDLALSRLLHTPPAAETKPLVPPPPPPALDPVPVPAKSPAPSRVRAAAQTAVPDPVRAMLGYIVEVPNMWPPTVAAISGGELSWFDLLSPTLPARDFSVQKEAREYGLQWANPVTWNPPLEASSRPPQPLERNLDARDFTRNATTPTILLEQSLNPVNVTVIEQKITNTLGEPMEIANQPRPPAPASIWHGGALSLSVLEPQLGDLARLSFAAEGAPPATPNREEPPQNRDEPPPSRDRQEAVATPEPPPPNLQAVSVTLQALSAAAGKPVSLVSPHHPAALEARTPEPTALPLRPVITLAPSLKPASTAAPAPSISSTAQKAPVLKRRADVRIVPVQPQPKPVQQVTPVAAQPPVAPAPTPTPAPTTDRAATTGSGPVKPAPKPAVQPLAEAKPKPAAVPASKNTPAKHNTPGATLISAEITAEHKPLATSHVADIGLPALHAVEEQKAWQKLPLPIKLGMAAALVAAIVGMAYMTMTGSNATAKAVEPAEPVYEIGRPINTNGWVEDWAPRDTNRRITLVRGSEPYSNYRFDFRGQIDAKAIGWMFRALNQRNFYVAKLEKVTSGLEPTVAFVRYAVIDGRNEEPVKKMLPMKLRIDTNFKVRFEAIGPKFTVWVLGEKIDEWKDARLGSGGAGFYSENGEFAVLQGEVTLHELVEKKN